MIIFDEKVYAENLLLNGYIRQHKKGKDLFILAKYFKYKGLSKFQAYKQIIKFVNKFDDTVYSDLKIMIKKKAMRCVDNAYNNNYTLRHNTQINISKAEIEFIGNLKTTGEKQVMFVLLVISKFFVNGTGTFYVKYADIFRYTNLTYHSFNINNIINSFIENGYLEVINKYKIRNIVNTYSASLYERNYFKLNIPKSDDIVYTISSFNNLMIDFAKSMKIIKQYYCWECSKIINPSNNKHQYCPECAKEVEKENGKVRFRKWYNKQKSNEIENR